MESNLYSINQRQFVKGLLVTVGSAILTYAVTALQSQSLFPIDWETVGSTALLAGLTYIKVTFFSNSKGEVGKREGN